ncbi:5'-nucleotidase C-terminal domain-containing protein [Phytohabitans flavus]|uniref:5'-nucleotidase C-terminal domain-containing protein n=1 Tax=Phytohabitans flavus TaxID=1076124 RepID=UPI001E60E077|nr:5'-nucleotidase C-terminal domain-containing protein [Phytohabitans flavus]
MFGVLLASSALLLTSGAPALSAASTPSISEIHYDNNGTDTGEAIEIEAPVGFDLSGWQIVLYNGANSAVYNTRTLSGTVPAAGVVVADYPANGIQNGDPDGVALVSPAGAVAEFLTYGGTFTAVGGPANGRAGTDIGVKEGATIPVGSSLQKKNGTWTPPAPHTFGVRNDPVVVEPINLQLLGINDFHGRLESPATVGGQPAGGAAQLAGLVGQLRAQNPNTAFVASGDSIGASTFISAIDGDNPTIDALNAMDLAASAVGNHEFDKGIADLTGRVNDRADFPYLGANVYRGNTRELPAYAVDTIAGVRVGYIGVVTEQTASLVSPDGIAGITFRDAVAEANLVAGQLKDGNPDNGEADVVVLLAHEGAATENTTSAEALANDPVFGKYTRVNATIDAIFSGHTHQPYAFKLPVPGSDKLRPVVQAEDYGLRLAKVDLTFDPTTDSVTSSNVQLVDVVGAPQDPTVAGIVAAAKVKAGELGQQTLGAIAADIRRAYTNGNEDRGKESAMGNFIADVQLAGTKDAGRGGAQIAFMNPGGLRADLLYRTNGTVTYADAFSVQPFANDVVTKSYTGAQIKQTLEEQWQPTGASRPVLWLGVSKGFTYTYDPEAAKGSRITSIKLNGVALDPSGSYRVTVNSFLAAGGDNFTTLGQGTNPATTGDNDLTMLVSYFAANTPVTADTAPRSTIGQAGPAWDVEVTARTQCVGTKAHVAVNARNADDVPLTIELVTPYGSRAASEVAPGKSAYQAFNSRTSTVPAGTATVTVTGTVNGQPVSAQIQAPFSTISCG